MCFRPDRGGVLGISSQEWGNTNGPHQTQGSRTMGTAQIGQSGQVLHRILQLLLKIHTSLLCNHLTTYQPNQERDTFQLGEGTG